MSDITTETNDIGQLVREMETAFTSGGGTLTSKYVVSDLYDDINKVYAYLESKHWSGETDNQGRIKPFFNIVLAARNIYYRATDIDRKNVTIKATKTKHTVQAFIAEVLLQNWMRKENFGAFLNDWGLELAAFNSSVVKFIEAQGKLHCMVVPWSRLICDQVDFDSNPKIEILELTEAQLYRRVETHGYDKEMVEKLCDALSARELTDKQKQDQKSNYIKLYEVHGNLPLSYITGNDDDEDEYVQQMQVISFVASKEKGRFDDFTLVAGREEQDPYMLTSLLPNTDGSVSLNGSVKNLFQAQWMMNHTVKSIKDQLDLANKLIFQTADTNFIGMNALTAIENGDILIHGLNTPLTQVQNNSHDITIAQSFGQMWKGLASEINGVSESMMGNVPPSGTAWRQVQALLQESHSLFELMTENKGLDVEKMLRRFVIPFNKKQMDHGDEIAATLEAHNITKIDAMYIPAEAVKRYNEAAKEQILNGQQTQPYDPAAAHAQIKGELAQQGNQRFFVPSDVSDAKWKDALKDLEWEVEVDITGESVDKNTVLATLSTALQTIANPGYANNPQAQLIVSKILTATGELSPLEISMSAAPEQNKPAPKISESISYKDAPEDIKRQIEAQAGLKPSQMPPVPSPVGGGTSGLAANK
jgi:hypothetical protein